jgi:hypothetical protein
MRGKLKTLEEIKREFKTEYLSDNVSKVYHSLSDTYLPVGCRGSFGTVIDISLYADRGDRTVYRDKDAQLYYDEWFEWIGEPPKPSLQNEFDNLINSIEGW